MVQSEKCPCRVVAALPLRHALVVIYERLSKDCFPRNGGLPWCMANPARPLNEVIYTAPAGRSILFLVYDEETGELVVTLDNGHVVRLAYSRPAAATLH
jgi:hypothetical protein